MFRAKFSPSAPNFGYDFVLLVHSWDTLYSITIEPDTCLKKKPMPAMSYWALWVKWLCQYQICVRLELQIQYIYKIHLTWRKNIFGLLRKWKNLFGPSGQGLDEHEGKERTSFETEEDIWPGKEKGNREGKGEKYLEQKKGVSVTKNKNREEKRNNWKWNELVWDGEGKRQGKMRKISGERKTFSINAKENREWKEGKFLVPLFICISCIPNNHDPENWT